MALAPQIERLLPLAAGHREPLDALVHLLYGLPPERQAEVGPPWMEQLVMADPDGIASRSFLLPEWLERVRPYAAPQPLLRAWHRIVDAPYCRRRRSHRRTRRLRPEPRRLRLASPEARGQSGAAWCGPRLGIWIGAIGPRMLALTGRLADGWIPSSSYVPPAQLPARQTLIDQAAEEAGRDPAAIRRVCNVSGRITAGPSAGFLDGPPGSGWRSCRA